MVAGRTWCAGMNGAATKQPRWIIVYASRVTYRRWFASLLATRGLHRKKQLSVENLLIKKTKVNVKPLF